MSTFGICICVVAVHGEEPAPPMKKPAGWYKKGEEKDRQVSSYILACVSFSVGLCQASVREPVLSMYR